MKIYQPQALNELGGRSNNEDSIFPKKGEATPDDRLFIVCDGVGGHAKGEIASSLTCRYFGEYFAQNIPEAIDDGDFLKKGLVYVENQLSRYQAKEPGSKGMSTTLTLLYLSDDQGKALVGWVGDSRVYHVRDGQILFRTKDHSEVQSLIDMGEITEEEAATHPRRNVITRAINGEYAARMDQMVLDDIQPGDYFFLCTDGILEKVDHGKIKEWFTASRSPEETGGLILKECEGRTKDNFSMYLVKVSGIKETIDTTTSILQKGKDLRNKKWKILTFLLLAALLTLAVICGRDRWGIF